jgi:hypothetical protein
MIHILSMGGILIQYTFCDVWLPPNARPLRCSSKRN